MKNINILYFGLFLLLLFNGCEELERVPLTKDTVAPMKVKDPVIENIPGGAIINYTLPDETDLLYVKAEYTLANGKHFETRSSVYSNSLKIEGYGDTNEHDVKLYTVDRSENISQPLNIKIQPLTPGVHSVKESLEIISDFGGVRYTWSNPDSCALAFIILAKDSLGAIKPIETIYSGVINGVYNLRGYDPEENVFGAVLRDRWDNYSDTAMAVLTPMFEQKLDKSKFEKVELEGDADVENWGGRFEYMYDDNISTFCHSRAGTGWPQYVTIDLGAKVRLSRFTMVQRQGSSPSDIVFYGWGNPRLSEIWGRASTPTDGSWDGWTKLRDCVSIRPTEVGGTPAEDEKKYKEGDEYSFTLEDPEVRYVRILVNETWSQTGFFHLAELTFFGQEVNN
uniref:DUF4959 domain-containing protein n=1 Tax=uncultured Draconibacterium sp. TaxID=1573823 RepID=UPI00321742A9